MASWRKPITEYQQDVCRNRVRLLFRRKFFHSVVVANTSLSKIVIALILSMIANLVLLLAVIVSVGFVFILVGIAAIILSSCSSPAKHGRHIQESASWLVAQVYEVMRQPQACA
jgi:hypothetical protein